MAAIQADEFARPDCCACRRFSFLRRQNKKTARSRISGDRQAGAAQQKKEQDAEKEQEKKENGQDDLG